MARGGYGRGSGVPLAERRRVDQPEPTPTSEPTVPAPHLGKHCWVADPAAGPERGRTPGLLVEWRRTAAGSFEGLVVHVAERRGGRPVVVHEWMPAELLAPREG